VCGVTFKSTTTGRSHGGYDGWAYCRNCNGVVSWDDLKARYAPKEKMYLVGYWGWGSVEEDLFWCEAISPEAALEKFEKECRDPFHFQGAGSHGGREPDDDRVFVYEMVELGTWRKTTWAKVG
jgi:hypothetical protein